MGLCSTEVQGGAERYRLVQSLYRRFSSYTPAEIQINWHLRLLSVEVPGSVRRREKEEGSHPLSVERMWLSLPYS